MYIYMLLRDGKCIELCFLQSGGSRHFTLPLVFHVHLISVVCGVCEGVDYRTSFWIKFVIEQYIRDLQRNEAHSIIYYMARINEECKVLVLLRVFAKVVQYLKEWNCL